MLTRTQLLRLALPLALLTEAELGQIIGDVPEDQEFAMFLAYAHKHFFDLGLSVPATAQAVNATVLLQGEVRDRNPEEVYDFAGHVLYEFYGINAIGQAFELRDPDATVDEARVAIRIHLDAELAKIQAAIFSN